MIFNNNIRKVKTMGRIKIDLDKEKINAKEIARDNSCIYYSYNNPKKTYDDYFIVKQYKDNPKKVISLGWIHESFLDFYCFFDSFLVFAAGGNPEIGLWDYFIFLNVNDGKRSHIRLRSEYGNFELLGGYGRIYNQDKIKKMYVNQNKLIIEFIRKKCNDNKIINDGYNVDMEYTLTFSRGENGPIINRSYEGKIPKYNIKEQKNISIEELATLIFNYLTSNIANIKKQFKNVEYDEETLIDTTLRYIIYIYAAVLKELTVEQFDKLKEVLVYRFNAKKNILDKEFDNNCISFIEKFKKNNYELIAKEFISNFITDDSIIKSNLDYMNNIISNWVKNAEKLNKYTIE